MRSYLLVLGERQALAWVLRHQRMAFPARRWTEARRLELGDELLLYTTRSCWHNPNRDRGRVIGRAYVTSQVTLLDEPIEIAGRAFMSGCALDVRTLTAYRTGVELAPLVDCLAAFPKKETWNIWLRRPLLKLSSADATLVRNRLAEEEFPAVEQVPIYLENIRSVAAGGLTQS
ncbi:hypothetical protein [Streptomyces sp. CNZ748]|uniref:hypothetical protein n=1 Tax=Streptomyces sp. CNZ748 TaxID=2885160 RepID=UPI00099779E7|nr:hypothetical protein [Streptomyces sp. CNZ748]